MQTIKILNKTTKSEGAISLRFRLRDGRSCDITHRSGIKADLQELAKLDAEGKPNKGVRIYNKQLADAIAAEIEKMSTAYALLCADDAPRNNATFARYMERVQNGRSGVRGDIETRFAEYIAAGVRDGIIGKSRKGAYDFAAVILHRFLQIERAEGLKPSQFDAEYLLRLRSFIVNEYKFVPKYPAVYAGAKQRSIPTEARSQNTAAMKLKMFQAFFAELAEAGEIERTPFAAIGRDKRHKFLRERYTSPVYLTAEELQTIRTAQLPAGLEAVRTAFVLQCAIGCRLGDFQRLRLHNVGVTPEGVAYVHYLPEKTSETADHIEEIKTPLVRYAFDIVKSTNFQLPLLNYPTGENGYNAKIKELLEYCEISRPCAVFNDTTGELEYKPLHELASSKLARKTAVDILNKAQINMYAAGLHKSGSKAVHHYTELTIKDRFALMCYAYGEKPYKATKDLQIVEYTKADKKPLKSKKTS